LICYRQETSCVPVEVELGLIHAPDVVVHVMAFSEGDVGILEVDALFAVACRFF
jgi:hypothetical protein